MNKSGQGLPITTIIIAALALIVLVVIILIFYGKIQIFGGELVSCTGKGGFCTSQASCASGAQTTIKGTDCLTIQETSLCHSRNANCHNNAKRNTNAKARIIKPTQNKSCFSPLNNATQLNTATYLSNNRHFGF